MPAVFLQLIDRLGAAVDAARDEIAGEAVERLEAPVPVDATAVRASRQERQRVELTIRGREHTAERRLVPELAPHAADGVAGERLHWPLEPRETVEDGRRLLLLHRFHDADREFPDAARELRRAQNRGLHRHVRVDVVAARQVVGAVRCAPDATGVEEAVALWTIESELQVPQPFDE